MELDPVKVFYDELSSDYHFNFVDWDKAISNQAKILDDIIKNNANGPSKKLLDCACGIGTQAIGLAKAGYEVTASDISPLAIKRAKKEAVNRNVSINFRVADIRQLETEIVGTFDVVICCDNSLPHLLGDDGLQFASQNIWAKLRPRGLFIASIRDYDEILETRPLSTSPVLSDKGGVKTTTFQTWDWLENNIYTVNHYIIRDEHGDVSTALRKVQYRAYKRNEVEGVFNTAGFVNVKWLMPAASNYYQPILLAFKL